MDLFIKYIVTFLLVYILVYGIYYFLVLRRKEKLIKFKDSTEVRFLKGVYKINVDSFDIKWLAKKVILTNSFVITLVVIALFFVESTILMIVFGFVLLFPVILISYYGLGKYLQTKQDENKSINSKKKNR